MNNTSSDLKSGYKFEDDLACLTEMFPCVDSKVLRNYLEIFSDQANYLSVIIDMLLQGDNIVGSNPAQDSTQKKSSTKLKTVVKGENSSCSVEAGTLELSPKKLQRRDSSGSETDSLPAMLGEDEIDVNTNVLSNNESESFTTCSKNSDKKGVRSITSSKCTSDDIAFVKCVASPTRQPFQRTGDCISISGTTSPSQHKGICIRYKGGVLHPSMNKPKKLQIVEIDADEKNCAGIRVIPSLYQTEISLKPANHLEEKDKVL